MPTPATLGSNVPLPPLRSITPGPEKAPLAGVAVKATFVIVCINEELLAGLVMDCPFTLPEIKEKRAVSRTEIMTKSLFRFF